MSNENFRYFMECYFNWNMDYDDLELLISDYLTRENDKYIIGLKNEINLFYELEDPKAIKDLIYQYGRRSLDLKRTKDMIDLLHHKLNR